MNRNRGSIAAGKLVLSLILSGMAAVAAAATGQEPSDSVEQRIQRVESGLLPAFAIRGEPLRLMSLTNRMEFHHVPGVSVAVINHGEIEWARGYGFKEAGNGDPVTTATLFQAASISKPVAAMAALSFAQRGKLKLDEDVNRKLVVSLSQGYVRTLDCANIQWQNRVNVQVNR